MKKSKNTGFVLFHLSPLSPTLAKKRTRDTRTHTVCILYTAQLPHPRAHPSPRCHGIQEDRQGARHRGPRAERAGGRARVRPQGDRAHTRPPRRARLFASALVSCASDWGGGAAPTLAASSHPLVPWCRRWHAASPAGRDERRRGAPVAAVFLCAARCNPRRAVCSVAFAQAPVSCVFQSLPTPEQKNDRSWRTCRRTRPPRARRDRQEMTCSTGRCVAGGAGSGAREGRGERGEGWSQETEGRPSPRAPPHARARPLPACVSSRRPNPPGYHHGPV